MPKEYNLYIDDSGTRHPDRKQGKKPAHGHDYFALGGVLIREEDEEEARKLHAAFLKAWNIKHPLHSSEIRGKNKNFAFIGKLETAKQEAFHEDLYQMMKACPVIGIACVIDRPGYRQRYDSKYGSKKWSLCKTAFAVLIERAVKIAQKEGRKLHVYIEKSDKHSDTMTKGYFTDLKKNGLPFDAANSAKYAPLSANAFAATLYDFKPKDKSSPMIQMADLYLWPMCMGGYDKNNRPYRRLMEDKKLIDALLADTEIPQLGIKYSCMDGKK